MVAKAPNPRKPMSVTERAFWREVFCKALLTWHLPSQATREAAEFADAAVDEYRKRITWRSE
jgi:uncharacterized protein VirK/YbjX